MMNKKYMKRIAVPVIILAVLIIFMSVVKDSRHTRSRRSVEGDLHLMETIAGARNHLSIQLNKARQVIGRMDCEMSKGLTNTHGGWCKTASTEEGGQHVTDMSLIPHLSFLLKEKTVASFGDGPGAYKTEIMKLGQVKLFDAFDGAPYSEDNSNGNVNFLDLTIPQYGIPLYDWIISLEVAEHIPKKFESIYLDNLFRHAKVGIILSWAAPGQVGLQHHGCHSVYREK
ncbi:unnamed protein product [Mytilus edulis]|uniref:Uncharacterized protein n=1 Tax=Mytilus edulis TaxID=6550 RepID=A0A8S3TPT8_MYTED|nr:unnamed protein product [Mytilus edulis]